MLTICHVAAIHEPTDRVLATMTPVGWLLPTMISPDMAASGALLARATSVLPLPALARCQANLQIDRATDSANVTLVVDIRSPGADAGRLIPIGMLRDTAPVMEYQAEALELLRPHAGASRSEFLRPNWIGAVATWAASVTGESTTRLREHAAVHRAEVDRAVVAFDADGRRWHFKGDQRQPFVEALVTQHIAAQFGQVVAPTVGFDAARGWWLTSHVDGIPLDARCWPAHLSAAASWSQLQAGLRLSHDALCALGAPALQAADLASAATSALDAVATELAGGAATAIAHRVSTLLDARLVRHGPSGVLHFDAASRNVLWNGQAPAFLDLESLCIGPAVIAGELMARRMRTALSDVQHLALAQAGASAALRLAGSSDLEDELWRLPALTDLCLLALRRRSLREAASRGADLSARYTWGHVALDFAARASSWPSSSADPGSAH